MPIEMFITEKPQPIKLARVGVLRCDDGKFEMVGNSESGDDRVLIEMLGSETLYIYQAVKAGEKCIRGWFVSREELE